MNLCDLHKRGFRLVYEQRRKVDVRGIDGVLILSKSEVCYRERNGVKFWSAAHYAKQNTYGEPVPIPSDVGKPWIPEVINAT